jgi:hypothetical protein
MYIKILPVIVFEVGNEEDAEDAVRQINSGLESVLRHNQFPYDCLDVDANNYEEVSEKDGKEEGWLE